MDFKRNKTFKVFITLIVIIFIISVISCKEASAIVEEQQQEEEKGQETVPSETKETTKETTQETTTQETTAPTETIPQTVEYKGMVFPLPEWSEANPQTGEILALVGNPYGVEAGTKIGQCIKDAFELNGKMENSIGLRPEVIEVLQQKYLKENKEFKFPIPFNLDKDKGIKMVESEDYSLRFYEGIENLNWATPKIILISNVPLGVNLLSPVNSDNFIVRKNNDGSFIFSFFRLIDTNINDIIFEGKKIDSVDLSICANGIKLPENFQEKLEPPLPLVTNIKIGMPFGEIIEKKFLEIFQIDSKTGNQNFNLDEFSITMCLGMVQGNEDGRLREATGYLQTASDNFLAITTDETKIPISLIPADETQS